MLTVDSLTGFACPQERLDPELLETIVVEYSRQYIRLFVERYGSRLEDRGRGLLDYLAGGIDDEASYETVWDPAFGEVRKAVLNGESPDLFRQAAALGLRWLESGRAGSWEIELGTPARLRWGRWLLPKADWIGVSTDGGAVSIETSYQGVVARTIFRRTAQGWGTDAAEELPLVEACGARIILMLPAAFDSGQDNQEQAKWSKVPAEAIASELKAAMMLLDKHAPIYIPWVNRVIRYVVPIYSEPPTINSASDEDKPGVAEISFGCCPAALAEMLVHEGTHQYYHLLSRLGSVDDGSDKSLYYSPVKDRGRPIDRILLAYHAFANVLLFYRLCRATGLDDDGYCMNNEEATVPQLEQLEAALRACKSLTQVGKALWEPLAERVNHNHGRQY